MRKSLITLTAGMVLAIGLVACSNGGQGGGEPADGSSESSAAVAESSPAIAESSPAVDVQAQTAAQAQADAEAAAQAVRDNPDASFVSDLAAALSARWAVADAQAATDDAVEDMRQYAEAVDAEWEIIGVYEDAVFEDEVLGEMAAAYLSALKAQKDAAAMPDSEYAKYANARIEANIARGVALTALADATELWSLLSEDGQVSLQGILDDCAFYLDEQQVAHDSAICEMIAPLEFAATGGGAYSATAVNTYGFDITEISFDVVLVDGDGRCVDEVEVEAYDWYQGTEAVFSFTTDKDFSEAVVVPASCAWTIDMT